MTTETSSNVPDTMPGMQVDVTPAMVADIRHQTDALYAALIIAKSLCKTTFAAKYQGKPEEGAVAILYGQRLGLDAIQSLQNVFVVHGTPSTYAKVMKAKLQLKGHTIRTIESTDKRCVVRGWRTGVAVTSDDYEESVWTIERADKAGYIPKIDPKTNKFKTNQYGKLIGNEKYLTDPTTMLYSRATSECCRRTAPEEILGIYDVNEMQDEERLVRVIRSERADQPSQAASIIAARAPQQQPTQEAQPEPVVDAEPVDISHLMPDPDQTEDAAQPVSDSPPDPESSQANTTAHTGPGGERVKELTRLMRNEKLTTRKQQVEWIDGQIAGHDITSIEDLTPGECDDLIGFLATEQARDAAEGPRDDNT